ncbi:hypothetical protein HIM_03772 [Hirsutella minnesotensis 3608]|uniref:Uncharacterized protein n=1 Tax=Hirsutella minnesotensis 3608 TaxID=1043627 RepID=A0A0F7ZQA2_9HYPO|nr:hypothetical protein HIM_03772 [Hirsutella minnesotensis 3608]
MSRITAPVTKIARAMGTTTGPVVAARPLRDMTAHNAGAVLMPKYADLLRSARSSEHHDSRGMTTTHRPTPQPSLANRPKPLMQTFHSSAPSATPAATANLDAAVLPSMADLFGSSDPGPVGPRMPLLPDNYSAAHGPTPGDGPVHLPSIVAADPDKVLPAAPLSALEGVSMDGVDLKFVHENQHHGQPSGEMESAGMIRDLWKGMVEDVLGPSKRS